MTKEQKLVLKTLRHIGYVDRFPDEGEEVVLWWEHDTYGYFYSITPKGTIKDHGFIKEGE